jgi:hypothetical protein
MDFIETAYTERINPKTRLGSIKFRSRTGSSITDLT